MTMLEKPDLSDASIITCLKDAYALSIAEVEFLPLGADVNAAVYRVVADDQTPYFLKLKRGEFDETIVSLPKYLRDHGQAHVIAPLLTQYGQLWANMDAFKTILYPFVDGKDGYEQDLTDQHWIEFGAALKGLHTTPIPSALHNTLSQETYSSELRESVKDYLARTATNIWHDPVAVNVAALMNAQRAAIFDLITRTERLAQRLQTQKHEFVVCHADIHAGNILIDASGVLYIVDWDDVILAPKERDLMFSGGGMFGDSRTPEQENALFYQGYGQTEIDYHALSYYRYERIIADIAAYCDQLLLSDEGGEDRAQSFEYLAYNFLPNGTIAIAYNADKTLNG
jgi:spectinomycin phosphotransferase